MRSIRPSTDRLAFRASLGRASLTLVLEHDPAHARRAMARLGSWAISHLERDVPAELGALVAAMRRGPAGADAREALDEPSVERVLGAIAATAGATVERRSSLPSWVRLPLWPVRTLGGRARSGGLFPFDRELAAFLAGRRRLIKREALDEAEAAVDTAWLESHGLIVRRAGEADREGRRAILAASEEAIVEQAIEAERSLGHGGDAAAARFLGGSLGYPRCCVEAFLALGRRDDATLLAARLPAWAEGPRDPRLLWSCPPLSLSSHVPCSPECPATLDLADAVLECLERERPGFTEAWLALASRLHVIDGAGRCWAFGGEGTHERFVVSVAHELCVPPAADLDGMVREAPELAGVVLSAPGAEVERSDDPGWRGFVAADHRRAVGKRTGVSHASVAARSSSK